MYKDKAVKKAAAEGEEEEGGLLGLGELLLILSLACDGITGAIQVKITVIQCCGSALVSLRIRIQHFLSMRIRIQIQGFDDKKLGKIYR